MLGSPKALSARKKCRAGIESFAELANGVRQHVVDRTCSGNRARQAVKGRGPYFPVALVSFIRAQARCQLSRDQRHDEEDAQHEAVLEFADVESVERRNEEKIPQQRAQGGGEKQRAARE